MDVNPMNTRLIRNTDQPTATRINQLFDQGVITDFSEDGWVLYKREWYPYTTFIERYNLIHESI